MIRRTYCFVSIALFVFIIAYKVYAVDDDYVVATVGDEKIYFSEIQKAAQGLNRFLKENFQTSKQWRLNYIQQYVARLALTKRARQEGLNKNKDVLFAMEQARRNILSDKILSSRLAEIKITEDGLKNYYIQNKAKYQIKEKIKLSYIKLKNKKEAERIIARLNKGKSFRKSAGGKIVKINEWISKGAMLVPELENIPPDKLNAVFALGVGGTSEPIKSAGRNFQSETLEVSEYYIFHIDAKEPARDRPFEEVRRQVEFEYNKKVRDDNIIKFINETFAQEKVKIYKDRIIKEMTIPK